MIRRFSRVNEGLHYKSYDCRNVSVKLTGLGQTSTGLSLGRLPQPQDSLLLA